MPPKSIPVVITCEHCGQQQSVRPSWATRKYCSRECSASAQVGKMTGPQNPRYAGRVDLMCAVCGSPFQARPGKAAQRRTCSLTCAAAFKAKAIAEYAIDEVSGCWVWQRYTDARGYARISVKRKKVLAHRAYYERVNGPIPAGMELDHTCNNPSCVNPAHLVPRTPEDHKRRHDFDYLSPDAIREIKSLFPACSQAEIARQFKIDPSTVSRIVRGENWADVG